MLPSHTARGVQEPFGSKGVAAAYEFDHGYKVGAGDRLTIRVAVKTDLSNDYLVDGAGNISMPYIRTTQVAGLTAAGIETMIAGRLRNGFLRNPSVSVQVTTLRPFFILGEVDVAGSFAYQPGMSVQNAVAIAGGYSPRANQGAVLVTRKNINGTATYKVPVDNANLPRRHHLHSRALVLTVEFRCDTAVAHRPRVRAPSAGFFVMSAISPAARPRRDMRLESSATRRTGGAAAETALAAQIAHIARLAFTASPSNACPASRIGGRRGR